MISLRPHARADVAAKTLLDAARDGDNVLGSATAETILDKYRRWASDQIRLVGQYVHDEEMPRTITTRRYWSIQNLDPNTYGAFELVQYVQLELRERVELLRREATLLTLEFNRWNVQGHGIDSSHLRPHALSAVVLDTNVLLFSHTELGTRDWHADLCLVKSEPIGLGIPLRVVRELDRSKMANRNVINRGTKDELRKAAGKALRLLEDAFEDPSERKILRPQTSTPTAISPEINLLLIPDRVPGTPLEDADAEIVDRALSLIPFAESVHVLSYDAGMVFRARQVGLHAVKLNYPKTGEWAEE